jgi:hypothetical protein
MNAEDNAETKGGGTHPSPRGGGGVGSAGGGERSIATARWKLSRVDNYGGHYGEFTATLAAVM